VGAILNTARNQILNHPRRNSSSGLSPQPYLKEAKHYFHSNQISIDTINTPEYPEYISLSNPYIESFRKNIDNLTLKHLYNPQTNKTFNKLMSTKTTTTVAQTLN
jgi:hypothetical protein